MIEDIHEAPHFFLDIVNISIPLGRYICRAQHTYSLYIHRISSLMHNI